MVTLLEERIAEVSTRIEARAQTGVWPFQKPAIDSCVADDLASRKQKWEEIADSGNA
jgi:hypothetical protein